MNKTELDFVNLHRRDAVFVSVFTESSVIILLFNKVIGNDQIETFKMKYLTKTYS